MFNIEVIKELVKLDTSLKEKYSEIAQKFENPENNDSHLSIYTILYQRYINKDEELKAKYIDLNEVMGSKSTEQSDEEAAYNFQTIDHRRIMGESYITSLDEIDFRFYTSGRRARVGDVYYRMLLGTSEFKLVPIIVHKSELNLLYIIYNMGEKNKYYESKNGMTIVQNMHMDVDDSTEEDDLFKKW